MKENIEEIKKRRSDRLEICRGCEFFNKLTTQCNKCGCIMSVKTLFQENTCPIGKW